jgi:hypothetical protein
MIQIAVFEFALVIFSFENIEIPSKDGRFFENIIFKVQNLFFSTLIDSCSIKV